MTSYYYYYQWESFRVLLFLCKLGLFLFYPHWDYQIQIWKNRNEMNSGLSSKKTPSFKWPFPLSFLKIHGQHHSSDPCTMQTKLGSLRSNVFNGLPLLWSDHRRMNPDTPGLFLRACLHGGVGPQIGEVTRGGWPHLLGKSDHIKMRCF